MTKLVLKLLEDSDVGQMQLWLNKPHVLKWYHDADEWLSEIKERNEKFSFLKHFIVYMDGKPIGFGQYYDCFDAKEDWYMADKPRELYSIDYFIGEECCLRKGYGTAIVGLLVGEVRKQCVDAGIVVQPEEENIASCRALLSNGFVYDSDKEYYILPGEKQFKKRLE